MKIQENILIYYSLAWLKRLSFFCKIKYHFKNYQHIDNLVVDPDNINESVLALKITSCGLIYVYGKLEYPLLRQLIDSLVVGRDSFSLQ